jgi:undecaprenyl-diphosphatase
LTETAAMTVPQPREPQLPDDPVTSPGAPYHERRARARSGARVVWDLLFRALRAIGRHAHGFYTTVGVFLTFGAAAALLGAWAFARLAVRVQTGRTQSIDESILRWIGSSHHPAVEHAMLEITFLGTGLVVTMIVLVAGLFLWLTEHRHSAALLVFTSLGALILNNLIKMGFDRPRPQIFTWGTHALTSSFPSGHAMSAAAVYFTVAYLAARLQRRMSAKVLTVFCAVVVVLLISLSRLYLGVHYPSDVLAGFVLGLGWAGFCMAMLEAILLYARRSAPQALEHEQPPAHKADSAASA